MHSPNFLFLRFFALFFSCRAILATFTLQMFFSFDSLSFFITVVHINVTLINLSLSCNLVEDNI